MGSCQQECRVTLQEELNQLLVTEGPALQVAKGVTIGLGVAVKLYTSFGGNLDNLRRIIELSGITNANQAIETMENIPGVPDRIAKPMIEKAVPNLVEHLVRFAWNKYIPKV